MNIKTYFRKLGDHNIEKLKEKIQSLPDDEWNKESWRQKQYEVHRHTRTISLIFDRDFRHKNPTIHEIYYDFESLLDPLLVKISSYYNKHLKYSRLQKKNGKGYPVRINIVELKSSGGKIDQHIDNVYSLAHSHRIHIPITTNKDVIFSIGKEERNLKEGEIWEVNNRQLHHVVNDGSTDRVHIIIDWVIPGERCCCGQSTRPKGICSPDACRATDQVLEPCDCYKL